MSRTSPLVAARRHRLAGRPSRYLAVLAALAVVLPCLLSVRLAAASAATVIPPVNVFFTVGSNIMEVPAGGGAPTVVHRVVNGLPSGLTIDTRGNAFYTDLVNAQVVELPAGGGPAVTLPVTGLEAPTAIAVVNTPANFGTLYVTDENANTVTTLLPNTGQVTSPNPSQGLLEGVAVSPTGVVYVAEASTGTVVGGVNVVARGLSDPTGLAFDSAGNLFIADKGGNDIVEVSAATQQQTTVVTGLSEPTSVAVDGAGDLFITSLGTEQLLEVPAGSSTPVPVASNLSSIGAVPMAVAVPPVSQLIAFTSTAPASPQPGGTYTVSATGSLSGNPVTFATDPSGTPSACSVSGSTVSFTGDGTCIIDANEAGTPGLYTAAPQATQAIFVGEGPLVPPVNLFVADTGNARVVELPAGGGSQAVLPASGLRLPDGIAVDAAGDVFVGDAANGSVVELPAGGGPQVTVASGLALPGELAVDSAGDLFIANSFTSSILEVPAGGGAPVTVATGALSHPAGVAVDAAGDLFIADSGNQRIVEVPAGGSPRVLASGLPQVEDVAVDTAGDVFFSDTTTGTVTELPAGGGAGHVVTAGLINPFGIAVDSVGDLFIADEGDNRIVEVAVHGGQLTTGGTGLHTPEGVAIAPPAVQAITFTSSPPSPAAVGGSYTVTATGGGSGNPVTFAIDPSSTASACSLSGSAVSFTGVGTCVIDANQAASAGYLAAPQVTQAVTIGPGTIRVLAAGSQAFGSSSPSFTFSSSPPAGVTLSGALACTTVDGGIPITAALSGGTYTIDGSSCSGLSPSDPADYSLSYAGASGQFTVNPASQAVTWSPLAEVGIGQPPFSVAGSASASGGGPLTFSATGPCTVTPDGTVSVTGSGTCQLTASQAGDNDFAPASATTSLVISPVGLSASASGVQAEQTVTLTAQVASDVSGTKSKLVIVDQATNAIIKSCASGTTCIAKAANPAGTHTYVAELVKTTGVVTATSPVVPVIWAAPTVTISASPAAPSAGQKVTITATASESVSASPLSIEIYDPSTDTVLGSCANGTSCAFHIAEPGGTDTFAAAILDTGVQVQLGAPPTVAVTWPPVSVTLAASSTTPGAGTAVTLTATASADIGPTADDILIVDVTSPDSPMVIAEQATGTRGKLSVTLPSPGSRTYVAEIADPTGSQVEDTSTPVSVTWH